LNTYSNNIFEQIVADRYRDLEPQIRGECISKTGEWIAEYPEEFFEDKYTKFIGWSLNDKDASVRAKALKTLTPLYATEDFVTKIHPFTLRFLDRIVEMTRDIDASVSVLAIKLSTTLAKIRFPR